MSRAIREVDILTNNIVNVVKLIVDRTPAGEEAIGRAIIHKGDLVSDTNRFPVSSGLLTPIHDYMEVISVNSFGDPTHIVYKLGGTYDPETFTYVDGETVGNQYIVYDVGGSLVSNAIVT